jgi:putative tricarboxylic transport membrane protein
VHRNSGTNGHLAIRMLASAAKVEPNEISLSRNGRAED